MLGLVKRNELYNYALGLFGVTAITWWEGQADHEARGLTVILHHSWWTWRGLRDRNRARIIIMATDAYQERWAFVEVI